MVDRQRGGACHFMLGCVVLAPVCLHLYVIFLSCVAFIFRSVSLSVYRVSFCLSGLCMYECKSARVFCVCVCIHSSVSVDLPVGIPLPFNSCRAGMLNLPLPWTSPPLPCSLHLLLPSSHCFCPPQCLHFATTSPPPGETLTLKNLCENVKNKYTLH